MCILPPSYNCLLVPGGVFGQSFQIFLHRQSCHLQRVLFLSSLSGYLLFSFSCLIALAKTPSTMLKRNACLKPDFSGKASGFSPHLIVFNVHCNSVTLLQCNTVTRSNGLVYINKKSIIISTFYLIPFEETSVNSLVSCFKSFFLLYINICKHIKGFFLLLLLHKNRVILWTLLYNLLLSFIIYQSYFSRIRCVILIYSFWQLVLYSQNMNMSYFTHILSVRWTFYLSSILYYNNTA